MGNRISISFKNGNEESVALFHHWGGIEFRDEARDYVREMRQAINEDKGITMLDRLEPCIVMVDFIRHITQDMPIVDSSLYLGKDENDGDNSDNGHHIIYLDE